MRLGAGLLVGVLFGTGIQLSASAFYSVTDLGTLGGTYSYVYGINNAGQVTGESTTSTNSVHAFLYSNGQMQDLETSGTSGSGRSINDLGQVVGEYSPSGHGMNDHAFLYTNGQIKDLGSLGASSYGYSINNLGQVVGFYNPLDNQMSSRAFLYTNGQMEDLNTPGNSYSIGFGINNRGQITGYAGAHAFLYMDGQMQDLGALGGRYLLSTGRSINDNGQIVGDSSTYTGGYAAFLYSNGQIYALNDLIDPSLNLQLEHATGINNSGQIIANGGNHAYLLTPLTVPEPGTLALSGTALFLIAAGMHRHRKLPVSGLVQRLLCI